ncbi:MAG: hypothetical protein ACYTGW_23145, partial [Planctomycetota bacterium]
GNPAATLARVNDLTLRVTAPNGSTSYWGNNGLTQGNYSVPGGQRDQRDTVENVFIKNPAAGDWKVEVAAYLVAKDTHVETPTVDADFALVVNGGVLVSKAPITISVGSFIAFGKGCPGHGIAKRVCQSINETASFRSSSSYAGVTYAVEVVASQNLEIEGYEMQNRAGSSTAVNLQTMLYDADTAGRPNAVLATGTMAVGTSVAWYKTTFNKKVQVKQGQKYFLAFVNASPTGTRLGTVNGGSAVPYWRNNGSGGSWIKLTGRAWCYRTICTATAGTTVPVMSSTDTPTLGQKFNITLNAAFPNTTAILMVGASNTTWSGGNLPFNLAVIGGGTCVLYVSLDALLSYPTSATGSATASLTAPTNKTLLGAKVYVQYAVIDPKANPFGHVTTNAATVVLGN